MAVLIAACHTDDVTACSSSDASEAAEAAPAVSSSSIPPVPQACEQRIHLRRTTTVHSVHGSEVERTRCGRTGVES